LYQTSSGKKLFIITAIACLGIAQLSSWLVETHIARNTTHKVTSFFYCTHIRNLGGIFGIMQGKGWIFGLISLVFLIGLLVYVLRNDNCRRFEYLCFGFVVGGGMSNILDRLIYGSVIDFIDIKGIPYWKYIFNIADIFIHLGIWPVIVAALFSPPIDESPARAGRAEA